MTGRHSSRVALFTSIPTIRSLTSMNRRSFFAMAFAAAVTRTHSARAIATTPASAALVDVAAVDRNRILTAANAYLKQQPITITSSTSPRSPGGPHDYFSEGPTPPTPAALTSSATASPIPPTSTPIAKPSSASAFRSPPWSQHGSSPASASTPPKPQSISAPGSSIQPPA